jgi:hypothetical protein
MYLTSINFQNIIKIKESDNMPNKNLKNRIVPTTAVDKKLYEELRKYSKETEIPLSRLLDKSIKLFLESIKK